MKCTSSMLFAFSGSPFGFARPVCAKPTLTDVAAASLSGESPEDKLNELQNASATLQNYLMTGNVGERLCAETVAHATLQGTSDIWASPLQDFFAIMQIVRLDLNAMNFSCLSGSNGACELEMHHLESHLNVTTQFALLAARMILQIGPWERHKAVKGKKAFELKRLCEIE
eukprot:2588802-Amphidinium_carterae.1